MLCVALLMCLFVLCVACLTVFVNCLVKQFAMCLGVVATLLLNVMDVFSVCGGALLDRPLWSSKECVLCQDYIGALVVTVIVRAGGAIWLNPFATVLFSVCSAVTVECCVLYPCCMGVFGMFADM